jgi:hypothetical protein
MSPASRSRKSNKSATPGKGKKSPGKPSGKSSGKSPGGSAGKSRPPKKQLSDSPYAPVLEEAAALPTAPSRVAAEAWAAAALGRLWKEAWTQADEIADAAAVGRTHSLDAKTVVAEEETSYAWEQYEKWCVELIDYLGAHRTRSSLAALRALAGVGEPYTREVAEEVAEELAGAGLRDPSWWESGELARFTGGASSLDQFGEVEYLSLGLAYGDHEYAVIVMVEHGGAGIVQIVPGEAAGASAADLLADFIEPEDDEALPFSDPVEITAEQLTARLVVSLGALLDEGPSLPASSPLLDDAEDSDELLSVEQGWPLLAARLDDLGAFSDPKARKDRREEIVDAFLTSPRTEEIADRDAVRLFALAATGWAEDSGIEPDAFGPLALGRLLLGDLPDHLRLTDGERAELASIVPAWAHFTADYRDLPEEAHEAWADALPAILEGFAEAYDDEDAVEHRATCTDVVEFRDIT